MNKEQKLTAIEKRAQNREALARFALENLKLRLPLVFARDPDLPPSPKRRYRSHYCYLGFDQLEDPEKLDTLSSFEMSLQLFDFTHLEPLLAAHIYRPSAKGQTPFHPVSMYLLSLFRRERNLSRPETLRVLRHEEEGRWLRRYLGFEKDFPSESGLRYFESCITPELQREIHALQTEALYQAGLLPVEEGGDEAEKAILSFDGMLHEARSRMRCAHARDGCYQPAPRACPAQAKGKRGCDCATTDCDQLCRYTTPLDPDARLIVYSGNKRRCRQSPNAPLQEGDQRSVRNRLVYGYYSYAGQLLDDKLATYWTLPGTFGPATRGDESCFPDTFTYLRSRFPWLNIKEVMADAGAGEQTCLDLIWEAEALRMVDIRGHKSDDDPDILLMRGYDDKGYPLCPFGYVTRSNGHDYQRRRTKWRCRQVCLTDPERPVPECDYLKPEHKHGYTVSVGRTHADGSVRLAREIPFGSAAWKERYNRRNSAESRNSVLKRLGLKRLPVHGLSRGHMTVFQGDFVANQRTLVRLIREATALRRSAPT
jgi:hypothetical protein